VSVATKRLKDAGFLFVREEVDMYAPDFVLSPSSAGEEALEMLDAAEPSLVTPAA
jgi:hypothetical protein